MLSFKKLLASACLSSLLIASTAQAADLSAQDTLTPVVKARKSSVHSSWGVQKMGFDTFSDSIVVPANVTVAVIDTGVDSDHFLLKGRLTDGYDFGENNTSPEDAIGHGTYMSGIIADCTKNVSSIKIMPLKVAGADGTLTTEAECKAIHYAVENGAKVINMSFAANLSEDHAIDEAINYAVSQGVTVVVAAGNDHKDASLMCPAHVKSAITVAALDKSGHLANYSNYGNVIDFAAPGSYVCGANLNDTTRIDSGTSVAAPHVAAAAAMIYAKYPDASPAQVESMLIKACKPLGASSLYGHGMVNLANLVK